MSTPFIVRQGEGRLTQPYNVLGMPVLLKLAAADTGGELSFFVARYGKYQGPPLHSHPVDETFYVIDGQHRFKAGDDLYEANPGDMVFIPRNTPHTTLCLSDSGHLLFSVNPGGPVEAIFARLDAFTAPPSVEEVIRVHEELGITILGAPLQP